MYIQPSDRGIGHDSGNREADLVDELTVLSYRLGSLYDALIDEEPRDKADQHKDETVVDVRSSCPSVFGKDYSDITGGFKTYLKREPVYEQREQGLYDRPQRADDGALVLFYELVLCKQHYLLSKALVLLEYLEHNILLFFSVNL